MAFNPWRCSANGGINALYCYLRVHQVNCDYASLVKEQSIEVGAAPCSALTLVHLAAKNGLSLQAVSLTMDELYSCAKPVIVHMDGETPEIGAFLMILSNNDTTIYFVNGPSATIQALTKEDFRRVWSGIALLPKADRKKDTIFGIIGFSAGLFCPLIIQRVRSKSQESR